MTLFMPASDRGQKRLIACDEPQRGAIARITVDGKFFSAGGRRWFLKGLTYGPFAPNASLGGHYLPDLAQIRKDFAQIQRLGGNAIRVYHVPPVELLDLAAEFDLRVMIDVPWEKHRCFFEDWDAQESAKNAVREAAQRCGNHPAVLAISVANEFPNDIVRFYGPKKIEAFIEELLEIVKEEAPQCLATFANYPTTEFLRPRGLDFLCFNVYLNDPETLGRYLDRLQHFAGNLPLALGEYGIDSIRMGEDKQAQEVRSHVQRVFQHGLAGSFVFAYTDDWYTGGHQIEDWAFGVTDRKRTFKPAALTLKNVWASVPVVTQRTWPKVSVVVCSYNGASTLRECLTSLAKLNYPDYEVILVDDGSKDNTREIAADFPWATYHHQPNRGLSVARNVGATMAKGKIVAYTDSDCIADPDWLTFLITSMQEQGVDAIGGPNIPPPSDGWIAKCVAASPGGPSHVMLDDRRAEHVPGCNMAFDREKLLEMGGFDAQFRAAGDDVDIFWRWMDRGWTIGFSAGAVVWHKRRTSIKAYLKQQKGYGCAEAMLALKHAEKFNSLLTSRWHGMIYGEGAVGLPVADPVIYHGSFGSGLFQSVYASRTYTPRAYVGMIEWYSIAALLLALSFMVWPLALVGGAMLVCSLLGAAMSAVEAPLPKAAPAWCRPVVFALYILQPVVRGWHRYNHRWAHRGHAAHLENHNVRTAVKKINGRQNDLYWNSTDNVGREELIKQMHTEAIERAWSGVFGPAWACYDMQLMGDRWHDVQVYTATEELGWPKRFTRCRMKAVTTRTARVLGTSLLAWNVVAILSFSLWGMAAGLLLSAVLLGLLIASRRRVLRSVASVAALAGRAAKLEAVVAHAPAASAARPAAPARASTVPATPTTQNGMLEAA